MISGTRLTRLVKAFGAAAIDAALTERPDLKAVRDDRGRTWLHLCAATPAADPAASVATARVLLQHGLDMNDAAFTEGPNGEWRATPLWFAISRGRNLALARFLLEQGCDPDHSLFAAAWNHDLEAIRLLVSHGAPLHGGHVVDAVGWSRFAAAEEFLRLGADPNAPDKDGRTALHLMLKKGSDIAHLQMFARYGARGDIPDAEGRTAAEIMRRKRDPEFREIADRLVASS